PDTAHKRPPYAQLARLPAGITLDGGSRSPSAMNAGQRRCTLSGAIACCQVPISNFQLAEETKWQKQRFKTFARVRFSIREEIQPLKWMWDSKAARSVARLCPAGQAPGSTKRGNCATAIRNATAARV